MNQVLSISFYSPIHIGTGEELEPFQYIIDKDNVLYTFSFHRFAASLSPVDKESLMNIQQNPNESSYTALRRFIRERYDKKEFLSRVRVSPQVSRIYSERFDSIENLLEVAPFIKTMNKPYIPGSSLKGAVRTAVLNYWADTFGDKIDRNTWEEDILKITYLRDNRKKTDITKDVFKYLKIPDIPMQDDSTWYTNIANFNLKEEKLEKTEFLMLKEVACSRFLKYEGFDPGNSEFDFTLTIDEKTMKDRRSITGRDDLTFDTLWQSLDFYDEILDREKEKWPQYDENLKHFYESFSNHLSEVKRENEIKIIKLGFGSGFEAVTIKKLRDTRQKYGKSIKMVEGKCPFGWAILRKKA
jgi:CRISPR-associated protein Csm5